MELKRASENRQTSGRVSQPDSAYEALKAAIVAGDWKPGAHLRETEIASKLGVSRTPVREALRRLVTDGLAVYQPGRGVFVVEFDKAQILDLYAMRESLEGTAARLAARHATRDDLERLWKLIGQESEAFNDGPLLSSLNKQFHQQLCEAAHNSFLGKASTPIRDAVALLKGTSLIVGDRAMRAHEEHIKILSAVEEGDAERAEAEARNHIASARRLRLQMMYNHL